MKDRGLVIQFWVRRGSRLVVLVLCLLCAVCPRSAMGQSLTVLRQEQQAAAANISRINAELSRVNRSTSSATERLRLLKTKIASRREIIVNINQQMALLDGRQGSLDALAVARQADLDRVVKAYRQTITSVFASLSRHNLRGHAAQRAFYFARLMADSLTCRADSLTRLGAQFSSEALSIATKREDLLALQSKHDVELAMLESETSQARHLAIELGQSSRELAAEVDSERNKMATLKRKIREAISSEVKLSAADNTQTQAEQESFSSDFAKNRGRLPSPLAFGTKVVESYGVNQVQKGVKLNSNGITLKALGSSRDVRAIFEGVVRRVFSIMGLGQCVIIRHGEYLSVYSSLSEVSVGVGQKITTSSPIGKVGQQGLLHFELWRENSPLNPLDWIEEK
ncbi:MAG: peptidoglycan DD-metalloendopeptidase family protein [Mucinivorans sp.]